MIFGGWPVIGKGYTHYDGKQGREGIEDSG